MWLPIQIKYQASDTPIASNTRKVLPLSAKYLGGIALFRSSSRDVLTWEAKYLGAGRHPSDLIAGRGYPIQIKYQYNVGLKGGNTIVRLPPSDQRVGQRYPLGSNKSERKERKERQERKETKERKERKERKEGKERKERKGGRGDRKEGKKGNRDAIWAFGALVVLALGCGVGCASVFFFSII